MTAQFKLIELVILGSLTMALLTACPSDKDGSDSDPGPASRGETSGGGETGEKPQV